ncbi:MAG: OmpH family outer membrane protein [Spirochaetes bacterium]|nr:OmpH family outer membrane protein [Spirochaetota bacterium]
MKYFIVIFILIMFVSLVYPITTSSSALKHIIKIGVVNIEKVFSEYAAKSKAAYGLRKKKAEFAKEIKKELVLIKKMEKEFKEQRSDLSDSEKRRRMSEIEFKKEELTNLIARRNKQLSREEKKLSSPILKEIKAAIRIVANREGVKLVLDSRSYVLYYDRTLDLTDKVVRRIRLIIMQKRKY